MICLVLILNIEKLAKILIDELLDFVNQTLQVKEEFKFVKLIRTASEIKPELITDDVELIDTIKTHPALQWATINNKIRK